MFPLKYHAFESMEHFGSAAAADRREWGISYTTADNLDWWMGNTTFVDPTVNMTHKQVQEAVDSIMCAKRSVSPSATIVFQMSCSSTYPSAAAQEVHALWKMELLNKGLVLEETPAKLLRWQASKSSDLLTSVEMAMPHKLLLEMNEIMNADKNSSKWWGPEDEWLYKLRQCQLAKGSQNGCFMASLNESNQPVALASIHLIEGFSLSRIAAVNWCGTNPEFRRKGHARNAMVHALRYVSQECGCESVYLTAVEEGPEALYRSLGFEVVEEVVEYQYKSQINT